MKPLSQLKNGEVFISFPCSSVGMQFVSLPRHGTQSVHKGVPTETMGTMQHRSHALRGSVAVDAPRPVLLTTAHTLSRRGASEAAFPRGAWERFMLPARSADNQLSSVLCPLSSERGISLIELIMYIVIVSVALAGILQVLNANSTFSADPFVKKQARAAAESLLEEIELQSFAVIANAAGRQNFNDIMDYNGYVTTGVYPANGAVAVSGLESYNVNVVVLKPLAADWGNIPAASAAQITVVVTDPTGKAASAIGYRVDY